MVDRLCTLLGGLSLSAIRRYTALAAEREDCIVLTIGEPDLPTPAPICEAAVRALAGGSTHYTANQGSASLRAKLAAYEAKTRQLDYGPDEIIVTAGATEAIYCALTGVLDPGDEVLIPQPSYVSYLPCAVMADAVPVPIELKAENDFKLTKEQLLNSITDKTKILVLPYPNNPTGAIMTKEELEELVPVIIEKDLYVISDEIYAELTYGGKRHCSIGSLPGMKERTIVINGFSKAFAMTGWRLGYACGPAPVIEQMVKLHQFAIMCAPTNSQFAAVEALKNCDMEVEMMVEAYDQRRRFLLNAFKEMGLECFEPYGAFYVFPSIKKFGMTSEEFATRLLSEQKLAVVPGTAFGASGEGFVRISYAYSIENLKVGLERIQKFIESLGGNDGRI